MFEPFREDTTYFGEARHQFMLNFRVADLSAMVAQLRSGGIEVEVDDEVHPNGRFARFRDPEGNPIAVWQPKGNELDLPPAPADRA